MTMDEERARIFHADPEILGGTPVFCGTRVPVATLTEWLEGGCSLEEFLDNFPTVERKQAAAFIRWAAERVRAGPGGGSGPLACGSTRSGAGDGRSLAPNLPPG